MVVPDSEPPGASMVRGLAAASEGADRGQVARGMTGRSSCGGVETPTPEDASVRERAHRSGGETIGSPTTLV